VLRHFAHRIDGDFIVLSCDFIPPPSLKLSAVLNKFRIDSASDGALMSTLWYEHPVPEKEKNASEDAWSSLSPTTAIVYDEASGTLLHIDTHDDQDDNSEEVELRMSALWRSVSLMELCHRSHNHVVQISTHKNDHPPGRLTRLCLSTLCSRCSGAKTSY
jgi:translation initiation factor eIF-2B subunit gamma